MSTESKSTFSDLNKRVIVGVFCVAVIAVVIYFSNYQLIQILIALVLSGIGVTGLWEYGNLVKGKGFSFPTALIIPLGVFWMLASFAVVIYPVFHQALYVLALVIFFTIFLYHFKCVENSIVDIATSFFGLIYIVFPLSLIPLILFTQGQDGRLWIAYLFMVTKVTDIGAYFTGKFWGRSKLAPHVSPGKTISGAIGGFVSAILLSMLFFCVATLVFSPAAFEMSFLQSVILGGFLGIFGQIGDLAESLFKRDAKMKDSNRIPGFGGILDMVDSLLFTIPILYVYLKLI